MADRDRAGYLAGFAGCGGAAHRGDFGSPNTALQPSGNRPTARPGSASPPRRESAERDAGGLARDRVGLFSGRSSPWSAPSASRLRDELAATDLQHEHGSLANGFARPGARRRRWHWHQLNLVPDISATVVRVPNGYFGRCGTSMCTSPNGWFWQSRDPAIFATDGAALFSPLSVAHRPDEALS